MHTYIHRHTSVSVNMRVYTHHTYYIDVWLCTYIIHTPCRNSCAVHILHNCAAIVHIAVHSSPEARIHTTENPQLYGILLAIGPFRWKGAVAIAPTGEAVSGAMYVTSGLQPSARLSLEFA